MRILALEFSSARRSVAICQPGSPAVDAPEAAQPSLRVEETAESGGRATRAFGLIDRTLRQADLELEAVEVVAVGLGPGSYTGVRAAIAIAQGWELARSVKLLGISSAECMAAQVAGERRFARFSVVIDAQRNEFYLATYESNGTDYREIEPLRLASVKELQERANAGEVLVGQDIMTLIPQAHEAYSTASVLARLAARRTDFLPGYQLTPIYLRPVSFVLAPPPKFT